MACLLGGFVVPAFAAEVIQSYSDDSVTNGVSLPTDTFNRASSFAVTYNISELQLADLLETGQSGSVFSFNFGTEMGMPFMYRVYYSSPEAGVPENTWGLFQQGGECTNKTIAATTATEWVGTGTFVFQYEETNDGALITFSKLSDDGLGFDTLISGTMNTYSEALGLSDPIAEIAMKIAYPEGEGTLSDVQVWSGVVAPSDLAASPTVPEPTTATLSLLALAGLAARRRR